MACQCPLSSVQQYPLSPLRVQSTRSPPCQSIHDPLIAIAQPRLVILPDQGSENGPRPAPFFKCRHGCRASRPLLATCRCNARLILSLFVLVFRNCRPGRLARPLSSASLSLSSMITVGGPSTTALQSIATRRIDRPTGMASGSIAGSIAGSSAGSSAGAVQEKCREQCRQEVRADASRLTDVVRRMTQCSARNSCRNEPGSRGPVYHQAHVFSLAGPADRQR
ncbi:hypothetical protein ASPZODRAFT_1260174 [Penicilliopsis zonata CBS 506.65]|uniref:Uncharacterized protein n=1 Tax=Penicilliopsis zonata CBS 506.65 TaxID=1073090 RepID=A0A1L9S6M0_9EURO|nr:hypothetical protein ASPZODRAFT_1260174 [Penicilliopsis zonata CBS 506.65]OJJ42809.1 hypothetical protein ASPZODRAFT_1260174 [Penicilliopsis zonata CBS 506.65]